MTGRIGRRWTLGVLLGWGIVAALFGAVMWVYIFLLGYFEVTFGTRLQSGDRDLLSSQETFAAATRYAVGAVLAVAGIAVWRRTQNCRRVRYDSARRELVSSRRRISARDIDVLALGERRTLTIFFTQPAGSATPRRPWTVDRLVEAQWPTVLEVCRDAGQEPPGFGLADAESGAPLRRWKAERVGLERDPAYETDAARWRRDYDAALREWMNDPQNIDIEKALAPVTGDESLTRDRTDPDAETRAGHLRGRSGA